MRGLSPVIAAVEAVSAATAAERMVVSSSSLSLLKPRSAETLSSSLVFLAAGAVEGAVEGGAGGLFGESLSLESSPKSSVFV